MVLAILAFYVIVAPSHIIDGDNAEFATLGTIGGTAHPSGYPLFLLWLRATSWLPGSYPAHTTAIATAMLGAATAGVLFAACRAWGASALAATIAVAMFAAAPVIVRVSTEAEVFALNNLVVAGVLWLAAREGPLRRRRRVIALCLVAGLGLSNHMTCTLVAPIGILGVVRGAREDRRVSTYAFGVLALLLGLVPYAYLVLTPDTPMSWGKVHGFGDLFAMVTRRDYGGPGAFLPGDAEVSVAHQLRALAMTIGRIWWYVPALAALVVAAWQVAAPRAETRASWILWWVTWLAAGPVLASRFNIAPTGLGLYVCQRFHVLPAMLLALPLSAGLDRLVAGVRRERAWCMVVATAGFVGLAATALPYLGRVHSPALENYSRNMLRTLPDNAVVFIGQDDEYFGAGYVQWALGERHDIAVVAPLLTGMPWYAERARARGVFAPPGDGPPLVRAIEKLLADGRPVFVAKNRAEVIEALPTYPYGTLMKVLPRGSEVPPIDLVVEENNAIFARFDLGYSRPGADDEFATAVHHRYAATWKTLARKADQLGRHDLAVIAQDIAGQLAPR